MHTSLLGHKDTSSSNTQVHIIEIPLNVIPVILCSIISPKSIFVHCAVYPTQFRYWAEACRMSVSGDEALRQHVAEAKRQDDEGFRIAKLQGALSGVQLYIHTFTFTARNKCLGALDAFSSSMLHGLCFGVAENRKISVECPFAIHRCLH